MESFLEELSLNAWQAIRNLHYDNWVLRFAEGHTRRSNSVNILGPSTIPLKEKVSYCEEVYHQTGLPPIFKFAGITGTEELDAFLEMGGYEIEARTSVMACLSLPQVQFFDIDFQIETQLTQQWLNLAAQLTCVDEKRKSVLCCILENIVPERAFGWLTASGVPAAVGIGVVERGWLGLFDIATGEPFRRKGLATRLLKNLMSWGQTQGAHAAYLQVVEENIAAIKLYESLGFERKYQYYYRTKRLN